jgi:Ca2+:H+ antiporter
MLGLLRKEVGLAAGVATAIAFAVSGKAWLSDLSGDLATVALFGWLFVVMLWGSFGVVRHADCLAIKLGEPYGTLILTLSVISIEVIMISAVMLTGAQNPELGRDMMFAVIMIVLNGLIGISLLLGGLRHIEQRQNPLGATTFLVVLIPLACLALIMPNYTNATEIGTYSTGQMIFLSVATIVLYGGFLFVQTMRHSGYFIAPAENAETVEHGVATEIHEHGDLEVRSVPFHAVLLVSYMLPIVLLSKSMAKIVDFGIAGAGLPAALGGMLVAVLVLAPEGLAAIEAARANRLQRSINICSGSAVATIGLTVPAVLGISLVTGIPVRLGLDEAEAALLVITFIVGIVNSMSNRTNVIQGLVHLVLFAAYILLIFD